MTPLISISDLIHDSWVLFKSDWKAIVKRNLWVIPVMIVYFILYAVGIGTKQLWVSFIGLVVLMIGSLAVALHAMRYALAKDGGTMVQATKEKSLTQLFWPTVLICLMTGLAVLGGMILFILPGIWFSIAAGFSALAYLEEGVTGTAALSRSMELVKGRWWKTLWRLIFPSIVFQIIIGIINLAVYAVPVLLAVIGGAAAIMSFSEGGSGGLSAASIPVLILAGILFIAAVIVNLFLSLVTTGLMQVVHAKLFHSLKASR
jgi:hypothetical protein